MPLVAWVWVYGAPSAHNSAEKLLNRWGTMAVLPLLELQVPRPTALIETCKVRPATKSIFSLENAVSPWTATDRLFVCALTVGAPLGNQALESLRNLGTGSTIATVDLLLELVEALESRMSEAAIFDIFLEKCAQTQSLRLMQGLGAVLVRSLGRGGRVSGEQRAILSKRATEVVEGQDSSLALARLALPDSLPFWREQRKKLLRRPGFLKKIRRLPSHFCRWKHSRFRSSTKMPPPTSADFCWGRPILPNLLWPLPVFYSGCPGKIPRPCRSFWSGCWSRSRRGFWMSSRP